MEFLRGRRRREGVLEGAEVRERPAEAEVEVAGVTICRQRRRTEKGEMYVTQEDKTGLANFVIFRDEQERFRDALFGTALMRLEGVVEREGRVVNVRVRRASPVRADLSREDLPQRNFR
jgi:error-prone DNA polymerase